MKKRILLIAFAAVVLSTSLGAASQQFLKNVVKVNYTINIDGNKLDTKSYGIISRDNTTYVPLRFIAENMGADVGYNQGEITILSGKPSQNTSYQTQSDKIQELERQLELIKKENSELKKLLEDAQVAVENNHLYKKMPVVSEMPNDAFKVTVQSLMNGYDGTKLYVSLHHNTNSSVESYYLRPRETEIVINGKEQEILNYTSNFASSLTPTTGNGGQVTIDGSFELPSMQVKGAKGYIKLYYSVFNDNTIRSRTIYFENH